LPTCHSYCGCCATSVTQSFAVSRWPRVEKPVRTLTRLRSPLSRLLLVALNGVVRDQLPDGTIGAVVRSASVAIVGKTGVVASATTDAEGRYSFKDIGGSFDLKVSKIGYREHTDRSAPTPASML